MESTTLFIGKEVKLLQKVDSTNRYALDLLRNANPNEGYLVWALEQHAGKGQRGKQWMSEPGANLTFSIILHPKFLNATEQFQLTKAIARGIAGFIASVIERSRNDQPEVASTTLSQRVSIKWPNDVYVHDSKIAGILIENVLEKSVLKHSVVGIGLNVNQTEFDPSLPNPTSLKRECGRKFEIEDCLKQLCSFIEKYYLILRSANHAQLDDEYHRLLYKRGDWSKFSLNNEGFEGKIEGISKEGYLLMRKRNNDELIVVKNIQELGYL